VPPLRPEVHHQRGYETVLTGKGTGNIHSGYAILLTAKAVHLDARMCVAPRRSGFRIGNLGAQRRMLPPFDYA